MWAPSDRRHHILPDSRTVDTQRTVSGRTRVHRIERRNDDNLCCWTSIEKWPRQYLGCHRRTRSQQRGNCLASSHPNPCRGDTPRELHGGFEKKTVSKFINMTQICVYDTTALRHMIRMAGGDLRVACFLCPVCLEAFTNRNQARRGSRVLTQSIAHCSSPLFRPSPPVSVRCLWCFGGRGVDCFCCLLLLL